MSEIEMPVDRRLPMSETPAARNEEETLVADDRATLSPSEIVEQKLIHMLRTSPLLVSQIQRRLKPGPR